MRLRDENTLELFAKRLREGIYTDSKHLTSILYLFAKFKWRSSQGDDYLQVALRHLMNDPGLNSYIASRNLWNLYAFDYYDKVAMDRFANVIMNTEPDKLNELDIANAVRSFAHFQFLDYDCLEVLLKQCIRRADNFNMQTLAVVLNSFAELDVSNPTLLEISKQILLKKIDLKATTPDG